MSSREILCKSQYVSARTLLFDFPKVEWMQGFSPKMSSFPKHAMSVNEIYLTKTRQRDKNQPRIAITTSSLRISMEPRAIKYKQVRTSPLCTKVSPGGACVVLNFKERALKQPGDAPSKAEQVVNKFRLRWRQMSACKHSGNPLSTEFMSMPLVYVHACWKYSSRRWRSGFGIWRKINLIRWISKLGLRVKFLSFEIYLMKSNKFSDPQHLSVVTCSAGVKSLNYRRNITEDTGVHESWNGLTWVIPNRKPCLRDHFRYSHPTNITQIVKIFSASVLGATLPKPTDVNDVNVK